MADLGRLKLRDIHSIACLFSEIKVKKTNCSNWIFYTLLDISCLFSLGLVGSTHITVLLLVELLNIIISTTAEGE